MYIVEKIFFTTTGWKSKNWARLHNFKREEKKSKKDENAAQSGKPSGSQG